MIETLLTEINRRNGISLIVRAPWLAGTLPRVYGRLLINLDGGHYTVRPVTPPAGTTLKVTGQEMPFAIQEYLAGVLTGNRVLDIE